MVIIIAWHLADGYMVYKAKNSRNTPKNLVGHHHCMALSWWPVLPRVPSVSTTCYEYTKLHSLSSSSFFRNYNFHIRLKISSKGCKNGEISILVCCSRESRRVWEAFEVCLSKLNLCICPEFAFSPLCVFKFATSSLNTQLLRERTPNTVLTFTLISGFAECHSDRTTNLLTRAAAVKYKSSEREIQSTIYLKFQSRSSFIWRFFRK